jgi:PKD repeat protein
MKLRLLSSLFCFSLLFSCANPPESCFVADLTIAEKGEIIIFDNCSLFADAASWDFGDGNTSTEYDPRYAYSSTGTFTATLTSSKGNKSDASTETILIGNRFLSYIDVLDLPTTDANSNLWDGVGDPADPQLFWKRSSASTWESNTAINTNLTNSLPFLYDMSTSFFQFTYEPWDFMLLDDDGGTADTMGYWTVDLDTVYPGRFLPLTGTNLDLKVRYTLE